MGNTNPNLWGREPAIILGAVNAVIALLVGFGLPVDGYQIGLINAAAAAILAVVIRSQVTPLAQTVERLDGHQVIAGPANDLTIPGEVVRHTVHNNDN